MQGIRILGTGRHVPEHIVTNDDFASFLDTSDEWIRTRTGMSERHIATDEPTWFLGAGAAKKAVAAAGLSLSNIDLIIGTTVSSDYAYPTMASMVQGALGIPPCMALDINVACTAGAFSLDMARRYLYTGDVRHVLIVSAESMSQHADYTDRSTCVLFGDGAGAVVVSAADALYASFQSNDPTGGLHLYQRRPRATHPFSSQADTRAHDRFPNEVYGVMRMNGREVYKFATRAMPEAVSRACEKAGITVGELDMIFVHQANIRIVETAAQNLGVPMERVFMNIDKYANTSSATMSICLDEALEQGRIKRGDKLCFVGFGAGLSYGAVVLEF